MPIVVLTSDAYILVILALDYGWQYKFPDNEILYSCSMDFAPLPSHHFGV